MAQVKIPQDWLVGKDLDILYKRYVSRYNDIAAKQKAKGFSYSVELGGGRGKYSGSMFLPKMSKQEFAATFIVYHNTMVEDEPNKKWSSEAARNKAIIENIISEQRHEFSDAQALAYQKWVKEDRGEYIPLSEIHKKTPEIKEQMSRYNKQLEDEGVGSGAARAKIISQVFFGSL